MQSGGPVRAEEDTGQRPGGRLAVVVPRRPVRLCAGTDVMPRGLGHPAGRCRRHVGDLIGEWRHVTRQASGELHVAKGRALLLLPFDSAAVIVSGDAADGTVECPAGHALLIAVESRLSVVWRGGTDMLAVYFQRDRLNAVMSALAGDGRRLASSITTLGPIGECHGLDRLTDTITGMLRTGTAGATGDAFAQAFYQTLGQHLASRTDVSGIVPPVRAVSDAMVLVREDHRAAMDLEMLAARVGVTGGTLRKGFRACLGMTVKEYVRSVRLGWAYERLDSGTDARPIHQLAEAAGFADAASFSRAYLQRYAETPSQTRARAVHRGR